MRKFHNRNKKTENDEKRLRTKPYQEAMKKMINPEKTVNALCLQSQVILKLKIYY